MVNRMGLRDALSLSWRNIAQNKGRSLIIVLTISILFGLLIGVNFVLRGLEIDLLRSSTVGTYSEAYVMVCRTQLTLGCESKIDQDMIDKLVQYGGQKVGEYKIYDFMSADGVYYGDVGNITTVDFSAVKDFVTVDLAETPIGRVPVLIPVGGLQPEVTSEQLHREFDERYYVVGYLPKTNVDDTAFSTKREIGIGNMYTPTVQGFSLLNLVLGDISQGNTVAVNTPIIVDDGSGVVEDYLAEKIEAWRELQNMQLEEWAVRDQPRRLSYAVAKFENPVNLIAYAGSQDTNTQIDDFLSNPVSIVRAFSMTWVMLLAIEVVVLVIAVLVATLTFVHVVDHDADTLALYRLIGASTGDICWIYFLYLFELTILAIGVACILGLLISVVLTVIDGRALVERWKVYYGVSELSSSLLLGVDWHFWLVIGAMLIIPLISLVFGQGRFMSKHVAKQLKED